MGGISATLPDNNRGYHRYRSYHLLRDRISNPMVVFYYQCNPDDICHQDIRPAIQHKDHLCHLCTDLFALAFSINSKQLCGSTGYDTGRQTAVARRRTGLYGLYHRRSHVWCRLGHYFQLQRKYRWNGYYRRHRQQV